IARVTLLVESNAMQRDFPRDGAGSAIGLRDFNINHHAMAELLEQLTESLPMFGIHFDHRHTHPCKNFLRALRRRAAGLRFAFLRFARRVLGDCNGRRPSPPDDGGLNCRVARFARSIPVLVARRTFTRLPLCAGGRCISSTTNRTGCVESARSWPRIRPARWGTVLSSITLLLFSPKNFRRWRMTTSLLPLLTGRCH